MNYLELEKYFKDENTLLKLLESYKSSFERIEYYGDLLRNGALSTAEEFYNAMIEMGGIYESLNSVAMAADAQKLNAEEILTEKKRVQRATKEIDSLEEYVKKVGIYRKFRNVFVDRRDACEKMISVLQSTLKSLEREKNI